MTLYYPPTTINSTNGAVSFSNSNGVTFGGNLSTITASVATNYAASDHSHGNPSLALTNLSGTTASNSAGLTISLSAADPGGGGTTNQTGPNIAAGSQTATSGTVVFSNSNGISFGMSNSSIVTASHNGITAQTDRTYSSAVFAASPNWQSTSASLGQNTVYLYPFRLNEYVSGTVVKIPVAITASSSAVSSAQVGYTFNMGIYSRNATNNTVLTQMYSTSYTLSGTISSNVSMQLGWISGVGNSTSYQTNSSSSAGLGVSSLIHGIREFELPLSTVMVPGDYWIGMRQSSSVAGTVGNFLRLSHIGGTSTFVQRMGVAANATNPGLFRDIGFGSYSATSSALPSGISATQINAAGTMVPVYFLNSTN